MQTEILKITSAAEKAPILRAAEILKNGGLVVIPTETVYGLAGSALSATAAGAIYRAKGRPSDNPLIVHISAFSQLPELITGPVPPAAEKCMQAFWPGPFTCILPKSQKIPSSVSGGLQTVAIRMPSNPIARAVITACGLPLAAPSANLSGSPSPTNPQDVIRDLSGRVDAILAAGSCTVGVESTVVTFATNPPRLLRPGGVTAEQLKALVPDLVIDSAVLHEPEKGAKVASPGMKYKHYAPKANITLFEGDTKAFTAYANRHQTDFDHALCFTEDLTGLALPAFTLGAAADYATQAERLFYELRRLDDRGCQSVLAHAPQKNGLGLAVYNRLIRAAGFKTVYGEKT